MGRLSKTVNEKKGKIRTKGARKMSGSEDEEDRSSGERERSPSSEIEILDDGNPDGPKPRGSKIKGEYARRVATGKVRKPKKDDEDSDEAPAPKSKRAKRNGSISSDDKKRPMRKRTEKPNYKVDQELDEESSGEPVGSEGKGSDVSDEETSKPKRGVKKAQKEEDSDKEDDAQKKDTDKEGSDDEDKSSNKKAKKDSDFEAQTSEEEEDEAWKSKPGPKSMKKKLAKARRSIKKSVRTPAKPNPPAKANPRATKSTTASAPENAEQELRMSILEMKQKVYKLKLEYWEKKVQNE